MTSKNVYGPLIFVEQAITGTLEALHTMQQLLYAVYY
jgi:hypothetical protein